MELNPNVSALCGAVSRPLASRLDDKTYRRYVSTLTSEADFGTYIDSSARPILFEVGRLPKTAAHALEGRRDSLLSVGPDTSYSVPTSLSDDFDGCARRFTNFTATFGLANLAPIVERLGKALAISADLEITSVDLRGGLALNVGGLDSRAHPVSASSTSVFIPRLTDTVMAPDVFSVIANAACGEGALVVTDVVEVDSGSRAPLVPSVGSGSIVRAILDALRLLGSNMVACDQGGLFAYALTRGIHQVATVVGHTDEGGFIRDVLRQGHFGTPFGGVHYRLQPLTTIPAVTSDSWHQHVAIVDSIALTTAAAVAHSDPGFEMAGQWYPTTVDGSAPGEAIAPAGESYPGVGTNKMRNHAALTAPLAVFATEYVRALSAIFGIPPGVSNAASHMSAVFSRMPPSRHLEHPSVSPFFWIEPTSLLPTRFLGSRAELSGCASLAYRGEGHNVPFFRDCEIATDGGLSQSDVICSLPTPRSSGLIQHLLGHRLDGLAHVIPVQLDSSQIMHAGSYPPKQHVRDRLDASRPVSDYLWVRGQSPLSAPGELLNFSPDVGLLINHGSVDPDTFHYERNHVPAQHVLSTGKVTFRASAPEGVPAGPLTAQPSLVRKARSRASVGLKGALAKAEMLGRADVSRLRVSHSSPRRGGGVPPATSPPPPAVSSSQALTEEATPPVLGRPENPNPAVGPKKSHLPAERGVPSQLNDSPGHDKGQPLASTLIHGASRGPQVPQGPLARPGPSASDHSAHMYPPPAAPGPADSDRPSPAGVGPQQ
jgi:hypothetical protein